jgi:hypothetical protein
MDLLTEITGLKPMQKISGLIYKEVVMWEYQPPNSGSPDSDQDSELN